ncbi:hypothetical protein NLG97_g10480 [Lecanicillium saksenae]|uniref:Uncharacterized protein n=1 Tax=Lecanicillium saksenae TaxID=468837 RepID=A0ACC1QF27_9HYPO|nr:hypothetical protein NLG97_g10480 [Lecanicillium saksenae]
MVCLAVYLGIQGQGVASKTVGMWWPIFGFVSLGFDHTVANMTFVPLGFVLGTPGLSVGLYIWKGIIPVVLGNIIGGGLFCGKSCLVGMPAHVPAHVPELASVSVYDASVPGLVPGPGRPFSGS